MPIDNSNLRKRAKKRGLTMSVKSGAYALYDAGTRVFGPGPADDAIQFLAAMSAPVGRPAKSLDISKLGAGDHRKARKFGYDLRIEDGVIRLGIGDDVVLETRDVTRLRLYFNNAEQRLVPWGPSAIAREIAAMRKVAEREQRVLERARRGEARRAERKSKRSYGVLDHDDPGIPSVDCSPREYRGLVETEVALPPGLDPEACLVALWAAEWSNPTRVSQAISAKLAAAAALPATVRATVTLSDNDRASIARHGAPAATVLVAAMLARQQSRTR